MYEYTILEVDDDEDSLEIIDQLNDLAGEGWKMVSCVRTSELIYTKPRARKSGGEILWKLRFFLEREKEEEEREEKEGEMVEAFQEGSWKL